MGKKLTYQEATSKVSPKPNQNQATRKGEGFNKKTGLYYCYYYDEQGKRKKLTSKTLEGLREKKAEVDNLSAHQVKLSAKDRTLDSVYEEWLTLKRGLVGHTKANYQWVYEHYCLGHKLGKMKIQEITKGAIRDHYNKLRDQKHLSVTTIDGLQTVVNQVCAFAVEERYIRLNPALGAMTEMKRETPKKQAHPALTLAEHERFLKFIEESPKYNHWLPIFKVFLGTGMRVAELTGLRWKDIDLENKRIHIDHNLLYYSDKEVGHCRFLVGKPKTKASKRIVLMSEDVKEAFIQQRELLEKSGRKCTVRIEGTDDVAEAFYTDFIFINKDGGPYHQGTLNKTIGRIVRDANVEAMDKEGLTMLPDFSNHCFRSTYITRCAEKKVPIAVTMKQVGHDDKKTTTGIYLTVHPDWMEQELSVMDSLFE